MDTLIEFVRPFARWEYLLEVLLLYAIIYVFLRFTEGSRGAGVRGRGRSAPERGRERECKGRIDCKSSRQHRTELDHAISAARRGAEGSSRESAPSRGGVLIG